MLQSIFILLLSFGPPNSALQAPCDSTINILNSFNTEKPDEFRPKFLKNKPVEYHLTIYDRWGDQVFSTKDFKEGWNGRIKDKDAMAQEGVYVWKLKYRYNTKEPVRTCTGNVTFIR